MCDVLAAWMDGGDRDARVMRAWAELAHRYGGVTCLNPETRESWRESWQYMGTYRGGHQFRHRSLYAPGHAKHLQRVDDRIAVAPGDFA